jgi:dTDP-4-amino-4,6-dideoxygalactose transaminase
LIDDLKHQQVATGVNYIPNHLHSHFVAHASSLPVTERLWREIVTLPLYCDMKETDVSRVIESVYSFFARRA